MSNTQFAYLEQDRLPGRAALQTAIDALGYDLQLYPGLDLRSDAGFSPCVFNGVPDVGFELETGTVAEVAGDDEEVLAIAGDKDLSISMTWRSSMKDCAAVMIVSCALQKDFGAVISYESEEPQPLEDVLAALPGIVAEAMQERKR